MTRCSECGGKVKVLRSKTPENIEYHYYKCTKCGEGFLDMKQLHEVAEKYRALKRYQVRLSKWGLSLGLRIPKDLVNRYNLKSNEEISMIPEKGGIRILASEKRFSKG